MKGMIRITVGLAVVIALFSVWAVQAHTNLKEKQRTEIEQEMSFMLGLVDGFSTQCNELGLIDSDDWYAGIKVMEHVFKQKNPKNLKDMESMFSGMDVDDMKELRKKLEL